LGSRATTARTVLRPAVLRHIVRPTVVRLAVVRPTVVRLALVLLVVGGLAAGCASSGPGHPAAAPGTPRAPQSAVSVPPTTADAAAAPRATTSLAPGDYVETIRDAGQARGYRLHVPAAAAGGAPLPLVLNLHGATQNAQLQELYSQMDQSADRHGYLVAYPDGTRIATTLTPDPVAKDAQYGFDAGACCGLPASRHLDDVDELLRVIDDVSTRTRVEPRRVYVTGMSNGGMMAYTMAAVAAGRIAAVASVAGQVELTAIHPSRPVPTLEFHSVDDPIASWKGSRDASGRYQFSVMSGIDQWVHADGCAPTPHDGATRSTAAGLAGAPHAVTATLVTWTGCRDGVEVALMRLTGSGHIWPGSAANTGPQTGWVLDGVGQGTTLVNADEVMWQFFSRFELPASS
jgi:polyhydroxybutyrate depolymerase